MKNDPAGDNSGALPSLPRQPQVIADNNINIINNIHNNINNIHNNINNIIIAERLGVAWGSRPLGSGYDQRRSGAAGGGGDPLKRPPGTEQHAAMCVSVWVTPSVRGAVAPRGSRAALGMRPLTEGDGEQFATAPHAVRGASRTEFARASRSHHHLLVASSLGHPPRGPRSPAAGPGEQHEQVTLLEAGMQRRRGPLGSRTRRGSGPFHAMPEAASGLHCRPTLGHAGSEPSGEGPEGGPRRPDRRPHSAPALRR
ncbi:unnamed protein product [Lampetra planeri]